MTNTETFSSHSFRSHLPFSRIRRKIYTIPVDGHHLKLYVFFHADSPEPASTDMLNSSIPNSPANQDVTPDNENTQKGTARVPGVLWCHGGGYATGMANMFYMERARDLVEYFRCVVVVPEYRLSWQSPFPAAFDDCWAALLWMKEHASLLGINSSQLMIGGESAGGGLCLALALKARDTQAVQIAYQMPLYPMLDNLDTPSSAASNHDPVWNRHYNHTAWKMYLKDQAANPKVSCYAAPARCEDFSNLPPAYTFIGQEETFFSETMTAFQKMKKAGVPVHADIYPRWFHARDMMLPWDPRSKRAVKNFRIAFAQAMRKYHAPQIS